MMKSKQQPVNILSSPQRTNWLSISSLFMGVTSLISAEFVPITLLTPIANDLNISEGIAGQSITVVGIFAVVTSLLVSPMTKRIDRKIILVSFSVMLIISNLVVAFTPNYIVMLIGRGLLGICVGGFWSMASAVVLQLAKQKDVPRALSIVYAGVSLATMIALPLSSYLGSLIGWRNVFAASALIGLIALIWQLLTLPSLTQQEGSSFQSLLNLLKQPWILIGIIATVFSYGGYHVVFSYLRPFLQHTLNLDMVALTTMLLLFGIANCVGTLIAGLFLGRFFKSTMIGIHLLFLITAVTLFLISDFIAQSRGMIIVFGFLFGFIPVGWSTWITRTLSSKAELMGGLSVAAIQLSIGLAAAVGGSLYDHLGSSGLFIASSGIMLLAILAIVLSFTIYKVVQGVSV